MPIHYILNRNVNVDLRITKIFPLHVKNVMIQDKNTHIVKDKYLTSECKFQDLALLLIIL